MGVDRSDEEIVKQAIADLDPRSCSEAVYLGDKAKADVDAYFCSRSREHEGQCETRLPDGHYYLWWGRGNPWDTRYRLP